MIVQPDMWNLTCGSQSGRQRCSIWVPPTPACLQAGGGEVEPRRSLGMTGRGSVGSNMPTGLLVSDSWPGPGDVGSASAGVAAGHPFHPPLTRPPCRCRACSAAARRGCWELPRSCWPTPTTRSAAAPPRRRALRARGRAPTARPLRRRLLPGPPRATRWACWRTRGGWWMPRARPAACRRCWRARGRAARRRQCARRMPCMLRTRTTRLWSCRWGGRRHTTPGLGGGGGDASHALEWSLPCFALHSPHGP